MKRLICLVTVSASLVLGSLTVTSANAADSLKMIMNWTADSAHLGFAMAVSNGYYTDADLDVELEEGRGSAVAAQMVATGQADLGYDDAGATLNAASKGAPVKIIATIWKSGQFGIQSLASSSINAPQDLKGKKIAVAPGTAMVALVPVFLSANGMAESDVEVVSVAQNAAIGLLTKGEIDAIAETPENTVVPLKAQGLEANNLYFYDNGVPLVSLSLIAREDKISANADVYRRFVEATLRGWLAAMQDPESAVAALKQLFPETENTVDALLQGATYSFSSVCPGGTGDHIGVTQPDTWEAVYGVMTSAMEFPRTKPVTDYYTMELLPTEPVMCP